jgi:hypothetical protein
LPLQFKNWRAAKKFNRQAPAHRRGLREALGAAAFAVLHQGQSVRVEEMIGEDAYFRIRHHLQRSK